MVPLRPTRVQAGSLERTKVLRSENGTRARTGTMSVLKRYGRTPRHSQASQEKLISPAGHPPRWECQIHPLRDV